MHTYIQPMSISVAFSLSICLSLSVQCLCRRPTGGLLATSQCAVPRRKWVKAALYFEARRLEHRIREVYASVGHYSSLWAGRTATFQPYTVLDGNDFGYRNPLNYGSIVYIRSCRMFTINSTIPCGPNLLTITICC